MADAGVADSRRRIPSANTVARFTICSSFPWERARPHCKSEPRISTTVAMQAQTAVTEGE
jgi:hypothetical protein